MINFVDMTLSLVLFFSSIPLCPLNSFFIRLHISSDSICLYILSFSVCYLYFILRVLFQMLWFVCRTSVSPRIRRSSIGKAINVIRLHCQDPSEVYTPRLRAFFSPSFSEELYESIRDYEDFLSLVQTHVRFIVFFVVFSPFLFFFYHFLLFSF